MAATKMTPLGEKPDIAMMEDPGLDTSPEKAPAIRVVDTFHVLGMSDDDANFYNDFNETQRKTVKHKVDIRLVPMLAILYLISHLDRSNIGNTKIEGIDKDLGISGVQWNIILSLFFIPYVLLEVPSNMLLKRFKRPSVYMGVLVTTWGVIMTLHGVAQNFGGLLGLRMLLGVFEAGFFPGAVYLCSFWYMPRDLASRISLFYCMSPMSGAFSGLLAAGIAQMDGVGGYEGWRWIFIIEGVVTIGLGILTFFTLVDTPALGHRWLSAEEIRFLELQLVVKSGGRFVDAEKEKRFIWTDLTAALCNWRMWILTIAQFCQSAMAYGTKFNLPTIVRGMGFTNTNAQLMSAPPYIAGAISAITLAKISDRIYWRMPFVVGPFAVVVVGFAIMMGLNGNFTNNVGAAYTACVIACIGIYPSMPAASSWVANNLAPDSRRAVGLALNIAVGNIGGIMGSYMFFDSDAPAYKTGFGLSLGFAIAGIIAGLSAELAYKWGNAKKARMTEEQIYAQYSQDELMKMGDKSPLFRYTL